MSPFVSRMAPHLQRFLGHKRALGFAYRNEEWLLGQLDRWAATDDLPDAVLDEALVRRFVADATRGSRSHRLTLVRQLARFLAVEEPRTFVPPRRFLGVRRQHPVIRVLSREEASRFLDACNALTDSPAYPHRGLIHGAALRTLLLTGLRRGEALALAVQDVDLDAGVISIRRGKFGKSRFVPVAPDIAQSLETFRDDLGTRVPLRGPSDAFFPGPDGYRPCSPTSLYHSFRQVLRIAGIVHGGRGEGPRLHELRHTFAVLRLLTWYEEGADLQAKLPLLATYLGHVGLVTSQVYLHMTRDLAGEVVRRCLARFGDLITARWPHE
jgi:integrase